MLITTELSEVIQLLAKDAASAMDGRTLSYKALTGISQIPSSYGGAQQIDVDLEQLRRMVADIIKAASSAAREIDEPDIERALRQVTCHYLWFC